MPNLIRIFVSSTSDDLKQCRDIVARAILNRGAHPIAQEFFQPSHLELSEFLANRLGDSDAVLCIIGFHFGSGPDNQAELPRKSWTQLEYEYAEVNKIPLLVFLASEAFQTDASDNADKLLQIEFRQRVMSSGRKFEKFSTLEQLHDLALKIDFEEIRRTLEKKHQEIRKQINKRWIQRVLVSVLVVFCVCIPLLVLLNYSDMRPKEFHTVSLSVGDGSV